MEELIKIISDNYSIKVKSVKELEGYANANFKVTDQQGKSYVLKLHQLNESATAYYTAESSMLFELSEKYPNRFQHPLQSIDGGFTIKDDYQGKPVLLRMLNWMDGVFLKDAEPSQKMYYSFGKFLGEMDRELINQMDVAIEARRIDWDLNNLMNMQNKSRYISDPSKRKLVEYFFLQYKENVVPHLPFLRKSIIQNDANDWNVLTQDGLVSGIIDFGDMVHSCLINELAIALAYALFHKEDPLKWAVPIIEGYHKVVPLENNELDVLYWLIAGRLCMSLVGSAWSGSEDPENEYISVSEKQAWNLIQKWLEINPVYAAQVFYQAAGIPPAKPEPLDVSLDKRFRHISAVQSVSYEQPIKMQSAAFQYMYDAYGNTFLDAYNNIPHVGHSHPKVVEAGQKQMAKLNTNTRYIYDQLAEYSEKLISKFPTPLNKVLFVNSGSAASDLAIRLAQTHTGKKDVVVLEHGYHGHTRLGIDISHYKFGRKGGKEQADFILKVPIPDTYRGQFKNNDGAAGSQYAAQLAELISGSEKPVAAFIAEPIVGCAGQVPLAKEYLKNVYPIIRRQGGVCISDEVQTGFGRMGSTFWGFEQQGVVPDIVVLGKPMGNGHPLAAVVTTDEIAESFDNGMEFFSSFGGNPVSCAIGMAVLEAIEEEGLQHNALETGNYFMNKLRELQNLYPVIGDVRGSGLFIGMELVKNTETLEHHAELANYIKNRMREQFILISTDGPMDNIIKMKPPLCFNKQNADVVVESIEEILKSS